MALGPTRRSLAGIGLLAAVLAGAVFVSPDLAATAAARTADDPVVLAAVLAALYLLRPLFAWPTTVLSVAVGAGYGVVFGVPVALVGIVVTTLPTYLAARHLDLGGRLPWAERVGSRYFERTGAFRGTVAGRLVPLPADVVTCGAAMAGVRLRTLVAGTVVGEVPWTVAAVIVGASAGRIATAGLDGIGLRLGVATTVAGLTLLVGPAYAALGSFSTEREV
jgi:uncharacterized membrane protein YdjX (TVP38/TMEM64 family)